MGRARPTPSAMRGLGVQAIILIFLCILDFSDAMPDLFGSLSGMTLSSSKRLANPIYSLLTLFFGFVIMPHMAMHGHRGGGGYDPKIFTVCQPWNGQRGPSFQRVFAPAFRNGLLGIHDKYNNLLEYLNGTDMGVAAVGAPPFPPGGGGAAGAGKGACRGCGKQEAILTSATLGSDTHKAHWHACFIPVFNPNGE